ncbi:speckle-type POZ protein-like [Schistocerca piceifrons]|uniref:speckle-type POZ protein-like n=1 Tax=Schistocerca piceifrons TaxID=274613 RepID=UPI001F5F6783|nr:speckle-type POZ protein-like [Schistocerca piceifrons]
MSYNLNNYQSFPAPGSGVIKSDIAEVAAGTPSILRHALGTRFENFSTFSAWTVRGLTTLPAGTTSVESIPFTHQNGSEWCMVLTKNPDGLWLSFKLQKCETAKSLRPMLKAYEIIPFGVKREVYTSIWCSLSKGGKSEWKLIRNFNTAKNEDEIILQCEICIQCIIQDKLPVADAVEPHIGVMKGLGKMFDEEVLTDFDLHAGDTVLKAHRAVLSVRSPYFAAMLQPHTKEAKEGRVELSDVKPEVLKQVLLYLYTGVAPALKDMPWDLLIAADMYQLHQLKGQCENHIASCLSVDNAAETAANAKKFSCGVLLDHAALYITHNLCKVMRTPGWDDILTTNPDVVKYISKMME